MPYIPATPELSTTTSLPTGVGNTTTRIPVVEDGEVKQLPLSAIVVGGGGVTSVNGDTGPAVSLNASEIPFTPTGSISATNVQSAVAEVASEGVKYTDFTSTYSILVRQAAANPVAVAIPFSSFVGRLSSGDIIPMTVSQAKTLLAITATDVGALPINGSSPMTGQLRVINGTAATPSLAATGDTNTGLVWGLADNLFMSLGGNNRYEFTADTLTNSGAGSNFEIVTTGSNKGIIYTGTINSANAHTHNFRSTNKYTSTNGDQTVIHTNPTVEQSGTASFAAVSVDINPSSTTSDTYYFRGANSTTPEILLEFGGRLKVSNGDETSPAISSINDPATGIYFTPSNIMFTADANPQVTIQDGFFGPINDLSISCGGATPNNRWTGVGTAAVFVGTDTTAGTDTVRTQGNARVAVAGTNYALSSLFVPTGSARTYVAVVSAVDTAGNEAATWMVRCLVRRAGAAPVIVGQGTTFSHLSAGATADGWALSWNVISNNLVLFASVATLTTNVKFRADITFTTVLASEAV